jgi:hypothetical protein
VNGAEEQERRVLPLTPVLEEAEHELVIGDRRAQALVER